MNIEETLLRTRKLVGFAKLLARRRGMTFFNLGPDLVGLRPHIVALGQAFAPKWIGGLLSNYAHVRPREPTTTLIN